MTTDSLASETRAAKGKKFYDLWIGSGGILPPGNYAPWDKLDKAVQARWIWFSKMMPEPKHDHHMPTPADVLKYPEATRVSRPSELWDYDSPGASYPASTKDAFYLLWAESRQARARRHWWQFFRPATVDTSRELFDSQLKFYLKNQEPTANL